MLRVLEPVELVLLSLDKVLLALLVLQHQQFLLPYHLKRFTFIPYLLQQKKTIARDVQLPRDLFIPPQPAHHYPSQPNTTTIIATS